MAKVIVIVEKLKDWTSFYPAEQLLTPKDYLIDWDEKSRESKEKDKIKIINLCRSYKYLNLGYYCSLLAEARGHSCIPSIKAINDLSRQLYYNLDIQDLDQLIQQSLKNLPSQKTFSINIFFGKTILEDFQDLARQIFDLFPVPILQVEFILEKKWEINSIKMGNINNLSSSEEDLFAQSLDQYSSKIWRKPRVKKKYRYELAVLINPTDPLPPSNKKAISNLIKAGKENNVLVETIEKKDFQRLGEYDGLFIRETTSLNHHTYRFAKKAQSEGLVVIDDPQSILRCNNKIYLYNVLKSHKIAFPKTFILMRDQTDQLQMASDELKFPIVLKVPDGAFSKGIYKVKDFHELKNVTEELFKKTSLLLAQEFFYTDFDWRIGLLNHRPLFACKYYMSQGHWQIYNHQKAKGDGPIDGDSETVPIGKLPKHVLQTAQKIVTHIGDSLYGVDLKEKNGKTYVIEVNDNPNIDAGVEDSIAGMDLYHNIINEFIRKIERKK